MALSHYCGDEPLPQRSTAAPANAPLGLCDTARSEVIVGYQEEEEEGVKEALIR